MRQDPTENPSKMTYSRAEVAEALGITLAQFGSNARRKKLTEAGFPCKLPGTPNWSKSAVDHWIRTGGLQYPPLLETQTDDDDEADAISDAARQLEDKYAGEAA